MKKDKSFDQITTESAVTLLRKGGILLKFCRRAPPHFVNIRLSFDDRELIYNRVGAKKRKSINMLRIADVQKGVTHRVFLGIFQFISNIPRGGSGGVGRQLGKLQEHAVTVSYFDKREVLRKLSIACTTPEEQQLWFQGLQQIVNFHQNHHQLMTTTYDIHSNAASGASGTSGGVLMDLQENTRASFAMTNTSIDLGVDLVRTSMTGGDGFGGAPLGMGLGTSTSSGGGGGLFDKRKRGKSEGEYTGHHLQHGDATGGKNGVTAKGSSKSHQQKMADSAATNYLHAMRQSPVGDLFVWGSFLENASLVHDNARPTILEGTDSLDVSTVAYGSSHGILVTRSGGVYSWGSGHHGELGQGINGSISHKPTRVDYYPSWVSSAVTRPLDSPIASAHCGTKQSAVISTRGELFVWGGEEELDSVHDDDDDDEGGDGDDAKDAKDAKDGKKRMEEQEEVKRKSLGLRWFPKQFSCMSGKVVLQVSCGIYHSALVTAEGRCYTWGDNFLGKLGHGPRVKRACQPKQVESNHLANKIVTQVACGTWHTAAIVRINPHHHSAPQKKEKRPGSWSSLYVWGSDEKGCLGLGKQENMDDEEDEPSASTSPATPKTETLDEKKTNKADAKGTCFYSPVPVPFFSSGSGNRAALSLHQIACGHSHTLVLSSKGVVYQAGQCGPAQFSSSPSTSAANASCSSDGGGFGEVNVHHETISRIACGLHHCVVVNNASNKVYSWGRGKEGQLGHKKAGGALNSWSREDAEVPGIVAKLSGRMVMDVSCGDCYTLCVCSHVDYDAGKIERELMKAKKKFTEVVESELTAINQHEEMGAMGMHERDMGMGVDEKKKKKKRDKKKSMIQKLKSIIVVNSTSRSKSNSNSSKKKNSTANTNQKRSSNRFLNVANDAANHREDLGGEVMMSSHSHSSPSEAAELAGEGSTRHRNVSVGSMGSTLDAMSKLGNGIHQVRSHANAQEAGDYSSQSPSASSPSASPMDAGQHQDSAGGVSADKQVDGSGGKVKVPNMERLAKRIVDLERQISQQSQASRPKTAPANPSANASEQGELQGQGHGPSSNDGNGNGKEEHGVQTPTHSRTSTWSFDLTHDPLSTSGIDINRLRKQSQSMENFSTPIGVGVVGMGGMGSMSMSKGGDATFAQHHLAAQNRRLKQKLREMESRLRQQANGNSGNSAHDNHKQDNGSEQATAGGAGIESSSSQKEDSVALSSVVVASGVKIFIRCQEDRTELYRVSYSSPSEEDSFKKWFADPQNKQDFMREHSITHIDVSGLKDTFLDSLI